jgi:Protein of unknown function (DUF1553)/Protein of unknown function (DUF1549)
MTRAPVWIGVSLLLLASAVVIQGAGAVVVHDAAEGYSFRNHVMPVLTKMGCNSGPCHGAAAGKNGFALTLRGYDPEADYDTLTRQAAGRRVNKLEPARSLMLLKPTETVPHMGGKRFEPDSPEYRVISRWIAAGMPPPGPNDPTLVRLEATPARQTLDVGGTTALRVIAHYSNGVAEDVTRWARYATADESIAQVDQQGHATIKGHGETAINAAFLTSVTSVRLAAPFPNTIPETAYDSAARVNFIDDLVLRKLRDLHLAPSGLSSDSTFIRRAYLDAAGILPPPDEVQAFLADQSPDKRARLVDRILSRPEWVDYWAYKWSDLLLVSSGSLRRNNVQAFYGWIRAAVAQNKPWNQFAYELTTASGSSVENGAVNFFLIHRNPTDLAENYTQAFLGLTVTCARCHNHPLEKWTQRDYYAFANLFARVTVKDETMAGKGDASDVVSTVDGDIRHPRSGQVLPPTPLDGRPMPAHSQEDRREYLARWLTAPDNALFARAICNRVWANFFGRGIVNPMDDLRATNPASNDELFDAVSRDFVANGFDVKRLMRGIMLSAAYQRASDPNDTNAQDDRYYSRYLVRRLPAEVILDAVSQITGVPEEFDGYPAGTRAMQLPDTRVTSYFLDVFGRPGRTQTSAAERMQDPTLTQALHAINGDTINEKLRSPDGAIARFVRDQVPDDQVVDRLYLAAFSRTPSPADRTRIVAALHEAEKTDRQAALEDLVWALLTSKEFLFNH